ncbi:MAG: 50S ribosomal protein L30 [Alphaproteobacteria bacterium]|jgi:large subunit ribosomal protein L30|nr:50S ribosomal protein L30 [Alphaproteobacteria bacterium]|tara:strand:- start:1280 stop:1480 length:201 start_codon:yes stop_codon:yes gene_type:complete
MKKETITNKTFKVTKIKSTIGRDKIQEKHLISLGLKKIGASRTIVINKSTKGLLKKVNHLVKIENS